MSIQIKMNETQADSCNCTTTTEKPYNGEQAAMYIVAVLVTYGAAIIFLLGLSVRRKHRHTYAGLDKFLNEVDKIRDREHINQLAVEKEKVMEKVRSFSMSTSDNSEAPPVFVTQSSQVSSEVFTDDGATASGKTKTVSFSDQEQDTPTSAGRAHRGGRLARENSIDIIDET